jgi:hypothetical protein
MMSAAHRRWTPRRRPLLGVVVAVALTVAGTLALRGGASDSPAGFVVAAAAAPAATQAPALDDQPMPAASRSVTRSSGPHLVPAVVGTNPQCRLTLPSGAWSLDLTAARALTMITAGAYRTNASVATAALAFEHALHEKHLRRVPTPVQTQRMLKHRYQHLPPTWAVDSVLALYDPQKLTCTVAVRPVPREEMLTNGLTMRAQTMLFAFFEAYGGRPVGGFEPGGIFTGHIENSAHYEGRAIDVSFPTSDPENNRRGWLLAQWLVAQADFLQIATVIFDDHLWSALHSDQGWRPYTHPSGNTTDPTLRHLDHVHVDVEHGLPAGPPPDIAAAEAAAACLPPRTSAACPTH